MTKGKKNQKRKIDKKTTKKVINKKIDSMKSNTLNELFKVLKLLFIVIVILSLFYLLTVKIVGMDSKEKNVETQIQYQEILAGSSFSMNSNEYLVVYYDFKDTKLSNLASSIYNYTYSGKDKLYLVDMSNGFNKDFIASEKSNTKPKNASDLLINGPTLIKITDGSVSEYIEGVEKIIDYLK